MPKLRELKAARYAITATHVRVFVVLTAITLIAFAAVSISRRSPEERAADLAHTRLAEARVRCEQYVRERLKAPSTAKFGTPDAVPIGSNQYRVTGSYDAQNSFGAMLRKQYVCDLHLDGSSWRLASLALP